MKIRHYMEEGFLNINLISENQKESYEIIRIANLVCKPVKTFGRVKEEHTYIWIKIPTKKNEPLSKQYFGNDAY